MPRILVIDDSLTIRKLVGISLERAGFEVSLASTGNEGLALAQRLKPDLITLDFKLPDLTAEDILTRLARDPVTGNIPVILMSARDDDVRTSMKSSGNAIDFISKPFNAPVIVARVKNGLAAAGHEGSQPDTGGPHATQATDVASSAPQPSASQPPTSQPSASQLAVPVSAGSSSAPPMVAHGGVEESGGSVSAGSRFAAALSAVPAPAPPGSAHLDATPAAAAPLPVVRDAQRPAAKPARGFPAWPFAQKEQLARVLFSKLRSKLAMIPTWVPQLGDNPAGDLARRLFTFDTVESLIDGLEPLFHANAQPTSGVLSGTSAVLGLEPVLAALAEQNKDGEIRLQHDGLDTVLQMTNGIIMLVSTTSASRYLEGLALDLTQVPQALMARAVAEQARSARPVPISLAEDGLKVGDVAAMVQRRGLELLKAALQQRCSYTFTPTATASVLVNEYSRPVTIEQLKIEAAREQSAAPNQGASHATQIYSRVHGFSRRVRRVNLDAAERKVASALDGKSTMQQAAARVGLSVESAMAAVRALEAAGLAEEVRADDPARPIHVVLIGERPDFSEALRVGIGQHRTLASYRVLSPTEADQFNDICDLMVLGVLASDQTEQLLARARQRFQGTIAVIAGQEDSEGEKRWLELGANLVLRKPVHVPTLCSLL